MAGQIYLGEAFKVEQSIELLLDKIFVSLHDDNDEGGQNRFHGLDKAEEEALMRWRSPFCRHINSLVRMMMALASLTMIYWNLETN